MRITVDHDLCIGDAICESICPEVFILAEDGLAYVVLDPYPESLHPDVHEALESCPTGAIALHLEEDPVETNLLKSIRPGVRP